MIDATEWQDWDNAEREAVLAHEAEERESWERYLAESVCDTVCPCGNGEDGCTDGVRCEMCGRVNR